MNGAVVQLGERHTCTVEVAGSIPVSSTKRVVSQLGELVVHYDGWFESFATPKMCRCPSG